MQMRAFPTSLQRSFPAHEQHDLWERYETASQYFHDGSQEHRSLYRSTRGYVGLGGSNLTLRSVK